MKPYMGWIRVIRGTVWCPICLSRTIWEKWLFYAQFLGGAKRGDGWAPMSQSFTKSSPSPPLNSLLLTPKYITPFSSSVVELIQGKLGAGGFNFRDPRSGKWLILTWGGRAYLYNQRWWLNVICRVSLHLEPAITTVRRACERNQNWKCLKPTTSWSWKLFNLLGAHLFQILFNFVSVIYLIIKTSGLIWPSR